MIVLVVVGYFLYSGFVFGGGRGDISSSLLWCFVVKCGAYATGHASESHTL